MRPPTLRGTYAQTLQDSGPGFLSRPLYILQKGGKVNEYCRRYQMPSPADCNLPGNRVPCWHSNIPSNQVCRPSDGPRRRFSLSSPGCVNIGRLVRFQGHETAGAIVKRILKYAWFVFHWSILGPYKRIPFKLWK